MPCSKLKLMLVTVFWFCALISLGCALENPGDALPSPSGCLNCTICQYPCQPLPPPDSGNPSYGGPPPPPPSLPGNPQGKCPPTPGVQCCQYTPPAPPYGVSYVPYGNHAYSISMPIFLYVIVILLFSFAVLF